MKLMQQNHKYDWSCFKYSLSNAVCCTSTLILVANPSVDFEKLLCVVALFKRTFAQCKSPFEFAAFKLAFFQYIRNDIVPNIWHSFDAALGEIGGVLCSRFLIFGQPLVNSFWVWSWILVVHSINIQVVDIRYPPVANPCSVRWGRRKSQSCNFSVSDSACVQHSN